MEDDQAYTITALVRIGEKRKDCTFGCVHALGHGHRPGGIHQEQHQVGNALDADLALQVGLLDREGQAPALFGATLLERCGRPEGGVECDVIAPLTGGARLDIAAVLALRAGERPAAGVSAG